MTLQESLELYAPEIIFGNKMVGICTVEARTEKKEKFLGLRLVRLKNPGNFEDVSEHLADLVFLDRDGISALQKALAGLYPLFDKIDEEKKAKEEAQK